MHRGLSLDIEGRKVKQGGIEIFQESVKAEW